MTPSGGLYWHFRALRYRGRLWQPFCAMLQNWLMQWTPPCEGLLLLGASAGWTLPDDFLKRFEHVHAVDADPLAPFLFGWNHAKSGAKISFERVDFFAHLEDLLVRYPHHAILFSNVLGQRGFHSDDSAAVEAELADLKLRLKGRHWASYHDRLSLAGPLEPARLSPFTSQGFVLTQDLVKKIGAAGTCSDHLTGSVLPDNAPRQFLPWQLKPGRLHWVEAGIGTDLNP